MRKRLPLFLLLSVALLISSAHFLPALFTKLYLDTFKQKPYEYMFNNDGGTLNVAGYDLGLFEAGFGGLFLYSGIKDQLENMAWGKSESYRDWDNLEIFTAVADINAFTDGKTSLVTWLQDDFLHYNPAFIRWGFANMVPAPTDEIDGVTFQEIYDVAGYRFLRLLAETHELLEREGKSEEADMYQTGMNSGNFDAYNFMDAREDLLADLNNRYAAHAADSPFTAGMAYTWWIRRTLDGSEVTLWKGISSTLRAYDRRFWSQL
ncbi:MAG: hypothetical protein AAFQ98_07210 [Bacteroidota bacterium]